MTTIFIDQEYGMKYLKYLMSIKRKHNLRNICKISIDKSTESLIVIDSSSPSSASDKELKAWNTEGILQIYQ